MSTTTHVMSDQELWNRTHINEADLAPDMRVYTYAILSGAHTWIQRVAATNKREARRVLTDYMIRYAGITNFRAFIQE